MSNETAPLAPSVPLLKWRRVRNDLRRKIDVILRQFKLRKMYIANGFMKFFSEQKKYGFITPQAPRIGWDSEDDIFCHVSRQYVATFDSKRKILLLSKTKKSQAVSKKSDAILYHEMKTAKGTSAWYWWIVPQEAYAFLNIESLDEYRLVESFQWVGNEAKITVLWEGINLVRFSLDSDDEQWSLKGFSCSDYDQWNRVEKKILDSWEPCEDPRISIVLKN